MKTNQIVVSAVLITLAFVAGRVSVQQSESIISEKAPIAQSPDEGSSKLSLSTIVADKADTPTSQGEKIDATSNSAPVAAGTCLTRVSRNELFAHLRELDAVLERFNQTDTQFPSRTKMNASDWKRVSGLGDVAGDIKFKIGSAENSKIKIKFKDQTLDFEVSYRRPTAENPTDMVGSRSSFPLINGRGTGLAHDGSSYHIVLPNPINDLGWAEYSSFALSIPLDWNGKPQVGADVFGLNGDMKWVNVGYAALNPAQ